MKYILKEKIIMIKSSNTFAEASAYTPASAGT